MLERPCSHFAKVMETHRPWAHVWGPPLEQWVPWPEWLVRYRGREDGVPTSAFWVVAPRSEDLPPRPEDVLLSLWWSPVLAWLG